MAVFADVDIAVRDGQRRRRMRWLLGLLTVVVVVAVALAWAWSDRVYLWDDYRAGWNAQEDGACFEQAHARYPQTAWTPGGSNFPLVGPNGRDARAFLTGCRDAASGSRFAPWHAMRSD